MPRTCLITGATSGIGRAAALELAKAGWNLWLVGRDTNRGQSVVRCIERLGTGAKARFLPGDISSLQAVRALARQVSAEASQLDVLLNNAGARHLQSGRSADGIEQTFATNHLGHFLLTLLLVERLGYSSDARIINVASSAHSAGRGAFAEVVTASPYDGRQAYAESKLANVVFTRELARRLNGTSVLVAAADPGGVATRFARNNGWLAWARHCVYYLKQRSLQTPRQGCQTIVWLATGDRASMVSGGYYADQRPADPAAVARAPEVAARLWDLSLRMAQVVPDEIPATWRVRLGV